jgi:hypothetical protein
LLHISGRQLDLFCDAGYSHFSDGLSDIFLLAEIDLLPALQLVKEHMD